MSARFKYVQRKSPGDTHPGVGVVLISPDLRVYGIDRCACSLLGVDSSCLGRSVLLNGDLKDKLRIGWIVEAVRSKTGLPPTPFVIDVRQKRIQVSVTRLYTGDNGNGGLIGVTVLDISGNVACREEPDTSARRSNALPVNVDGTLRLIDIESIYLVKSEGNYCRVYTRNSQYYVRATLKTIQERCGGGPIFQAHRSYLVNLDHVCTVTLGRQGDSVIELNNVDAPSVPVAKRRLRELMSMLQPGGPDVS